MTYRIAITTYIEGEIIVEAETEDEAIEMVEEGIYVEEYANETVGFEVKGWCDDEAIRVESVCAPCGIEIDSVEED